MIFSLFLFSSFLSKGNIILITTFACTGMALMGFTYGPLLGLYSFGLFTKWKVKDKWVPLVAIFAVISSVILNLKSKAWFGFEFGFEILIVNGLLTFIGLMLIRRR